MQVRYPEASGVIESLIPRNASIDEILDVARQRKKMLEEVLKNL